MCNGEGGHLKFVESTNTFHGCGRLWTQICKTWYCECSYIHIRMCVAGIPDTCTQMCTHTHSPLVSPSLQLSLPMQWQWRGLSVGPAWPQGPSPCGGQTQGEDLSTQTAAEGTCSAVQHLRLNLWLSSAITEQRLNWLKIQHMYIRTYVGRWRMNGFTCQCITCIH